MTLAALNFEMPWPGMISSIGGTPALATDQTLDAAGEYIEYIFCARQAMVVSHVAFRTGAVSGSPTVDVRIETVGADGLTTGTLWGTTTNIVTGALSATTTALQALTASATIAAGQVFGVKIIYASGTSVVIQALTNLANNARNVPYQITNTSGSAVKARFLTHKILALGSSTTAFYPLPHCFGATAITNSNFNNTNAAARALRFQIPVPSRAIGIRHYQNTVVGDFSIVMYDDAGSELSSSLTAYEGDQSGASGGGYLDSYFDNPVTLAAATWYRAAIVPASATNCNFSTITLVDANYRKGSPFGVNAHYAVRASGSWDDTQTTLIPLLDVLLDEFDDGAGGGGGGGLRMAGAGGLAAG